MSFNYDRDYNLTGDSSNAATGLFHNTSFDTTVRIIPKNNLVNFGDGYFSQIPLGVNNIEVQFNFNFKNKNDNDTYDIVSFFELLNGTGIFNYQDPAGIYSEKQLYIDSLTTEFVPPNKANINAGCYSDTFSTFLNYKKTILNTGVAQFSDWQSGNSYLVNDVVFDVSKTGSSTNFTELFYYCKQDHTADTITTSNTDYWTQEFEWQPNEPLNIPNRIKTVKRNFVNSYYTQTTLGINNQKFETVEFNYISIDDKKLRAILHFLLTHYGYKKFIYRFPKLFNENKYWVLRNIEHNYRYFNLHDLRVTISESLPPVTENE